MIYLIVVLFYSIWITINCDDWSMNLFTLFDLKKVGDTEEEDEEEDSEIDEGEDANNEEEDDEGTSEGEELIEGGDKMKYYVLLIVGINAVVNIFIEWVVMRFVRHCYEERQISNYKKEILEEKMRAGSQENDNNRKTKEVSIYKYQRVYFYDRRKEMEKSNNENGKNNAELVPTKQLKVNVS